MQDFGDGTVGYGVLEARLEFTQASESYRPTAHDLYWKIALAVPNIEFACRQLLERGVAIGEPQQFKNIAYLAHFEDPEGFTIELIDHAFKGERLKIPVDETALGGGTRLNLLTLRTGTIENARRICIEWGMVPLSIQPVEDHNFTLYFFGFTNDVPPNSNLQAIENRPWLYQRPFTVLEFQFLHDKPTIEIGDLNCAGYSGFTISDEAHITEVSCDNNL